MTTPGPHPRGRGRVYVPAKEGAMDYAEMTDLASSLAEIELRMVRITLLVVAISVAVSFATTLVGVAWLYLRETPRRSSAHAPLLR